MHVRHENGYMAIYWEPRVSDPLVSKQPEKILKPPAQSRGPPGPWTSIVYIFGIDDNAIFTFLLQDKVWSKTAQLTVFARGKELS